MTPKLRYRIRNSAKVLIWDAWQFWVTVVVLVLLILLPRFWFSCPEIASRRAGILLQVAGLVTVAVGIRQTRHRFGRPSLAKSLTDWLAKIKNAWLMPPQTVTQVPLRATISGSGSLSATLTSTGTRTLAERVRALEATVDDINARLAQVQRESSEATERLQSGLVEEGVTRERSYREVRLLIEDQAAGGLHLELMGLVWLLAGTLIVW